jgi:hypothetical protein
MKTLTLTTAAVAALALAGCAGNSQPPARPAPPATAAVTAPDAAEPPADTDADVKAERAKLSPEDRALVEAQEWCAVMTDDRLGAMGPPVKVMVKDTPVFLCCKSCQKKALADPDKTLAKVEDLKARKKAAGGGEAGK